MSNKQTLEINGEAFTTKKITENFSYLKNMKNTCTEFGKYIDTKPVSTWLFHLEDGREILVTPIPTRQGIDYTQIPIGIFEVPGRPADDPINAIVANPNINGFWYAVYRVTTGTARAVAQVRITEAESQPEDKGLNNEEADTLENNKIKEAMILKIADEIAILDELHPKLDTTYAAVFRTVAKRGLSYQKAADTLGCKKTTISNRVRDINKVLPKDITVKFFKANPDLFAYADRYLKDIHREKKKKNNSDNIE